MRIETVNRSVEEFEIEALLGELNVEREYIFCRETPVRRYLLSHYTSEDLKTLFETYHVYIEKYVSSITNLVIRECRALGLYRRPISLSLLKVLIEKSINILQLEKRNRRGPKKRKESKSAYKALHRESLSPSPQTRGGKYPRGAGARAPAGGVRATETPGRPQGGG
jgi:hypothetical protein